MIHSNVVMVICNCNQLQIDYIFVIIIGQLEHNVVGNCN